MAWVEVTAAVAAADAAVVKVSTASHMHAQLVLQASNCRVAMPLTM
jgi:hypothetical protein